MTAPAPLTTPCPLALAISHSHMRNLLTRLLDAEDLGHAVSAEVRTEARCAVAMARLAELALPASPPTPSKPQANPFVPPEPHTTR